MLEITIPGDPLLVGQSLRLQAMTASTLPWPPLAFTSAVAVAIEPWMVDRSDRQPVAPVAEGASNPVEPVLPADPKAERWAVGGRVLALLVDEDRFRWERKDSRRRRRVRFG